LIKPPHKVQRPESDLLAQIRGLRLALFEIRRVAEISDDAKFYEISANSALKEFK